MEVFSLVVLFASVFATLSNSGTLIASVERLLFEYKSKVQIVYGLLEKDCPSYMKTRREETSSTLETKLEVEKAYYEQLVRLLVECRNGKAGKKASTFSKLTLYMRI